MFGFDDLEDLIEADVQYGLFEDNDKQKQQQIKNNFKSKIKKLKVRILEKNIE